MPKVRVNYTQEISDEDLAAFAAYRCEGVMPRRKLLGSVRQVLIDLGDMGLEEQIAEGRRWLANPGGTDG